MADVLFEAYQLVLKLKGKEISSDELAEMTRMIESNTTKKKPGPKKKVVKDEAK